MSRFRLALCLASAALAAGVLVPVHSASAQPSPSCEDGVTVPDPDVNAAAVADCQTLLASVDAFDRGRVLDWGAGRPLTQWQGISLSRLPALAVVSISLDGDDLRSPLRGTLPSSLGDLASLVHLDFGSNRLTGPVPSSLGNLSSLSFLRLSGNELTGPVPSSLTALESLRELDLSDNRLTGRITIGLGAAGQLESLKLNDNLLAGRLPRELNDYGRLRHLDLSGNRLSGAVAHGYSGMSSLRHLDLSDNRFEGDLPTGWTGLSRLRHADFSDNRFSGPLPPEFAASAGHLWLNGNMVGGEIPAALAESTTLKGLWLHDNRLIGALPPELGSLQTLEFLFVDRNRLAGCIPQAFKRLMGLARHAELGARTDLAATGLPLCRDGANAAPWFGSTSMTLSVTENAAAGTAVGTALRATDPENHGLYYRLQSEDSPFAVEWNSGLIRVDGPLDHETAPEHRLILTVSDGLADDGTPDVSPDATLSVTIVVGDVAVEPPMIRGQSAVTVDENMPDVRLLSFEAIGSEGQEVPLTLQGRDRSAFRVGDGWLVEDGILEFAFVPDYERPVDAGHDNTYDVRIVATENGRTATRDVQVTVADRDEAPVVWGDRAVTVSERGRALVGAYGAFDPEGASVHFTLGGADASLFSLAGDLLSFEETPDFESPADSDGDNVYELTLTASDGGASTTRRLLIRVADVTDTAELSGPSHVTVAEAASGDPASGGLVLGTYRASLPAGSQVRWRVAGRDASAFDIGPIGGAQTAELRFRTPPDFELPADADRNNRYEVEVQASNGITTEMRAVRVTVIAVDEPGEVTLSLRVPAAGAALRATLEDPDGVAGRVRWQWYRSEVGGAARQPISGTNSSSYRATDDDIGTVLSAQVTYADRHGYPKTAVASAAGATIARQPANVAPRFDPSEFAKRRSVEENAAADTPVGAPLLVSDDDRASRLTYRLDGAAAKWLRIDPEHGQILTRTVLDREATGRMLVGTARVTDAAGASHAVRVSVDIIDIDEPLTMTGPNFVVFAEGSTASVGRYNVFDPEGASIRWSLAGADAAEFRLSGAGRVRDLRFRSPPDLSIDGREIRQVTIVAQDDNDLVEHEVRIEVRNVDEAGTVTITPVPRRGRASRAGLADADGSVDVSGFARGWEWQYSCDRAVWVPIAGANSVDRDVTALDEGRWLRAAVAYSDGEGPAKFAASVPTRFGTARSDGCPPRPRDSAATRIGRPDSGTGGGQAFRLPTDEGESDLLRRGIPRRETVIVIANSSRPADIGIAAALAARLGGAVVAYTEPRSLPDATRDLLRASTADRIVIVGGAAVVSDAVRDAIEAAGGGATITRLNGRDRYATAEQAARWRLDFRMPDVRVLVVANGASDADIGIAASRVASMDAAAVAFTTARGVPAATRRILQAEPIEAVIIIGGSEAISERVEQALLAVPTGAPARGAIVTRISGRTRLETAANAAFFSLVSADSPHGTLIVASGWLPSDIGVAASLASRAESGAVMYSTREQMPEAAFPVIRNVIITRIFIIGSTSAVSESVRNSLDGVLSGAVPIQRISGASSAETAALAAAAAIR